MKVILVLGGGGLVGKTIKDIDKPVNYKWIYATSSDADLRDINQVRLLFEHVKPTLETIDWFNKNYNVARK